MEKAVPKEGDPIDEDEREINQGMYQHEENNQEKNANIISGLTVIPEILGCTNDTPRPKIRDLKGVYNIEIMSIRSKKAMIAMGLTVCMYKNVQKKNRNGRRSN